MKKRSKTEVEERSDEPTEGSSPKANPARREPKTEDRRRALRK